MKEYKTHSAKLLASGLKFAIVISRWHELINEKLLGGALDTIERHGGSLSDIEVFYVPGSFEIPVAVQKIADSKKYSAIIALGTVIRGNTLHFDLIANEVVKGIASISIKERIPVTLGILTTDTLEQAFERAGSKQGNKGSEAALSAIEMANLFASI